MSLHGPHSAPPPPESARLPVVVVTGLSGAGLSTALKSLEDLGYEAVDNLRLSLFRALLTQPHDRPLVVGIDSRTRDFDPPALAAAIEEMRGRPDLLVRLLYMDASDEVLQRRYTETRRPHPLGLDRPVLDGVARERRLLQPLKDTADEVLDTSDLSIHDARRHLAGAFGLEVTPRLQVFVTSFSYRNGVPREADLVFDVRFLENPHYVPELRPLTGLDRPVQDYIRQDPDYAGFFERLTALIGPLLPRYVREGKHYLTIAIGCTGGKHRSVFLTHGLATWLAERGYKVVEAHRELDRKGMARPSPAAARVGGGPVGETPGERR